MVTAQLAPAEGIRSAASSTSAPLSDRFTSEQAIRSPPTSSCAGTWNGMRVNRRCLGHSFDMILLRSSSS